MSPPKQKYLVPPLPTSVSHNESRLGTYAFSIPLSNIYSLLIRPPSLGWWFGSVVINTRSGSSMPALFFHDSECESTMLQKKKRARDSFDPFDEGRELFWGGDEVLRWLKRYVSVERSTADSGVYLIDPSEQDRIGFGQARKSVENQRRHSQERGGIRAAEEKDSDHKQAGPGMDPLTKALKETRWKILEQLSRVTTFTRRTVQDVADNQNLPPQVRRLLHNPEVQTLQDEFDSARLYLARWAMGIAEQSDREKRQRIWTAKDVLEMEESSVGEFEILDMEAGRMSLGGDNKRKLVTMEEWESFFDARTGRLQVTVDEVKERVFHGGLDPEDGVRKEAWLFLLGVYEWESTSDERHAVMNSKRDEFIRLKGAWWERMVEGGATPEHQEWWKEQKGRIGKLTPFSPNEVKCDPLTDRNADLGIRNIEKDVHRTDRHIPLFAGEDIPHPDPSSPFYVAGSNGTNVHLEQLKDMLLTYLEYDSPSAPNHPNKSNAAPQNLGYVQGMSDLLAPIYAVMQDDAVAFWGFVGFMERMARNFVRDQSGMQAQLQTLDQLVQILDPKLYLHLQSADSTNFFFFFRMLLVWYKREFEWSDVLHLWEILWTDYLSSQMHLFVAVAILEKHRDVIMEHLKHFDEVLKYVNELSGTIDLQSTLLRSEGLFRRFEKTVEAVDKKDNFPIPNAGTRQRKPEEKAKSPGRYGASAGASTSADPTGVRKPTEIGGAVAQGIGAEKSQVISPQLRLLLSRKVIMLEKVEEGASTSGTRPSGLND